LVSLFVIALFVSCEVEFDPNSDWKEIPVVYCILDQDDDTTFVRVEKAFMGEGNYLQFSKEKDSIYYKADDLDVRMLVYYQNDTLNAFDTIYFNYTEDYQKPDGTFNNEKSPVYYSITKNRITNNRIYKLLVTNLKTWHVASSRLQPITNYSITKPDYRFLFKEESNNDMSLEVQWYNRTSSSAGAWAKLFQVMFKFYYTENGVPMSVEIPLAKVVNDNTTSVRKLSKTIQMSNLLNGIKAKLKDNNPRQIDLAKTSWMELYVMSCDVNMYDYINVNQPDDNLLTERPIFTNIDGGLGLFAARRKGSGVCHTFTDFTHNATLNAFQSGLNNLNIGF
jgi:hypothetical protein